MPRQSNRKLLDLLKVWKDLLQQLYPEDPDDTSTRCHSVPPLHLNKGFYRHIPSVAETNVPALVALKPDQMTGRAKRENKNQKDKKPRCGPVRPPYVLHGLLTEVPGNATESDTVDDLAQNHVISNLQRLGARLGEAMFILSKLDFCLHARNLQKIAQGLKITLHDFKTKHEADVVIFHPSHGLLLLEIKGVNCHNLLSNVEEVDDKTVIERLEKAVKQIINNESIITVRIRDITGFELSDGSICKALCLPYIQSRRLLTILSSNKDLAQKVRNCLRAREDKDAVQMCVCADQLSDPHCPWDIKDCHTDSLLTWWQRVTHDLKPLNWQRNYLNVVASFVVPLRTEEIYFTFAPRLTPDIGVAVAKLGHQLARIVLTEEQEKILIQNIPYIYIHGPPGTGKTTLLILKALQWLKRKYHVHVISTRRQTVAASLQIENQLRETIKHMSGYTEPERIHMHVYDFNDDHEDKVDEAIKVLKSRCKQEKHCILTDESVVIEKIPAGCRVRRFLTALKTSGLFTSLWCAGAGGTNLPAGFHAVPLLVPLRTAPVIRREVDVALQHATFSHVLKYRSGGIPAPGDGPPVIRMKHERRQPHTGEYPVECQTCGRNVAAKLRRLGVNGQGQHLQWRDVFIITRSSELQDKVLDGQGNVTTPACGFVQGLRAEGVPARVMKRQDYEDDRASTVAAIERIVRAEENSVTVTCTDLVLGLERRVVVRMVGRWREGDAGKTPQDLDVNDRMFNVSRCSTQLVVVEVSDSATDAGQSTGSFAVPRVQHSTHKRPADDSLRSDSTKKCKVP